MPHIVVHGRFEDTNQVPAQPTPATFAYYFPTGAGVYEGRFIVGAVHQLRLTGEVGLPDEVGEAADNGAYLLEFSPNQDYALAAYDALGENASGTPVGDPSSQYRVPQPRRSTRGSSRRRSTASRTAPTGTSMAAAAAPTSRSATRSRRSTSGTESFRS